MFESHQSIFVVKSRKGYEKRRALVSAAFNHLVQSSIQSLTVVHVCDVVGLKRNSFYNYFSGIDELLDALSSELFSQISEKMRSPKPSQAIPDGELGERVAILFDIAHSDPGTSIVLHRLYTYHGPTRSAVQRIITTEVLAGIRAGQISIALETAPVLARMLIAVFMDVLLQIGNRDAEKISVDLIFELLAKVGEIAKNTPLHSSLNKETLDHQSLLDG